MSDATSAARMPLTTIADDETRHDQERRRPGRRGWRSTTAMTETPANSREEQRPDQDVQDAEHDGGEEQGADDRRAGRQVDARREEDGAAERQDADDQRGEEPPDPRAPARLPLRMTWIWSR